MNDDRPQPVRLFELGDATRFLMIAILAGLATKLPDPLDPDYPYASALYSLFSTIPQVLGPIVAVIAGLRFWRRAQQNLGRFDPAVDRSLTRSIVLLSIPLVASLPLIYLSEAIRSDVGVRNGVVVAMVLLSVNGVVEVVRGVRA